MRSYSKFRYLTWLALPLILWWVFRSISLQEVWAVIQGLAIWQIAMLVALNLGITLLFSSRWWIVLRAQGYPLPYLALGSYRLAGFGVSYFTPGPQLGGEPLQYYLLRRHHPIPGSTAAASISLDKLVELLANFSFLIVGSLTILISGLMPQATPQRLLPIIFAMLMLPLGYLIALRSGWHPIHGLLTKLVALIPAPKTLLRWSRSMHSVETQAANLCKRDPRTITQALLLAIFIWMLSLGEYWLMMRFLGISLSPAETIAAMTAARLAFLLPVPGGLGTLEASQIFAYQAMGFSPIYGISASLLIRTRDVLLATLGVWIGAKLAQKTPKTISPVEWTGIQLNERKTTL